MAVKIPLVVGSGGTPQQLQSGDSIPYAPTASPTFTGTTTAPEFSASGLTGATTASRWVGGVAGAAPTSGTFAVGDWVTDTVLGGFWTCTVAGTSGTWIYAGPSVVINAQTGTTYSLVLADAGKLVTLSNASAIALTIPANSSVAFPVGTVINILQLGAGRVTTGITTDTLDDANGLITVKQYSMASLAKILSTTWVATGDLAAT